jgi:transketolase
MRKLPQFTPKDTLATRESASRAEQTIAKKVWNLFGGAADLNESTFVDVVDGGDFERHDYAGRNLHFGIREHGMCAILNGVALHGGFIPYGSSFLIFTDYCRPSLRLAALMGVHVIYVFTHDSIGLGEDGPTHQSIEQLSGLRAIPNFTVIRPGDANEAAEAWRAAMLHRGGRCCWRYAARNSRRSTAPRWRRRANWLVELTCSTKPRGAPQILF